MTADDRQAPSFRYAEESSFEEMVAVSEEGRPVGDPTGWRGTSSVLDQTKPNCCDKERSLEAVLFEGSAG